MIWRSTTFRFAALVFLLQIATAVVLLAGLGAILRAQTANSAVDTIETMRDDLLATYGQGGVPALARAIDLRTDRSVTHDAVLLLVDPSGRRAAGNLTDWPPSVTQDGGYAELDLYRMDGVKSEAMVVRATVLPGGERLLTGIVVEGDRQILDLLGRASLLVLALSLVFAALAAWLAARLIVRRLDGTITTLIAVREGALARRVPPDASNDAFAILGAEVNRTLDRVATLIGELKIATDSLAHDLKSPLTRLHVALESAEHAIREPAAQDAIDRAMLEAEQLMALVETALSISRAEAGIGRESFVSVDLADMLETIAEIYAPLVEDNGREIIVDASGAHHWLVHRQLMGQAIGNLIDNAIKYGDGTITLSLSVRSGVPIVSVSDQGGGVPADRRDEAMRRFGRLDAARGGSGAGLGLSLVEAVAHLHGGAVELGDAKPGLIVDVKLGRAGDTG